MGTQFMTKATTPRILIVDDIKANLLALEAIISQLDVDIYQANSGPEAIEACREREYAVIILDVMMPGMDGFETARRIKQVAVSQNTPILFLTAIDTDRQFADQGYEVGAFDYLTKPIKNNELLTKLNGFIGLFSEKQDMLKRVDEDMKVIQDLKSDLEARVGELNDHRTTLAEIIAFMEENRSKSKGGLRDKIDSILVPIVERAIAHHPEMREQYQSYLKQHGIRVLRQDQEFRDERVKLTRRELEICELIEGGASSKDIADKLNLSIKTVESHRKHIRRKLGIQGRGANLITYLRSQGR